MNKLVVFVILSIPVLILSGKSLKGQMSHGFYRLFSWECILWLIISNIRYWFTDPFSALQLISWILLIAGGYLVTAGVIQMKRKGKAEKSREDNTLFDFEKTTELVDTGIFRYIRHPLYSSLVFLTWGIFLKNTTAVLFIVSLTSTIFLYLTALQDEKECIRYFGDIYADYMKRTKRFIPFLI